MKQLSIIIIVFSAHLAQASINNLILDKVYYNVPASKAQAPALGQITAPQPSPVQQVAPVPATAGTAVQQARVTYQQEQDRSVQSANNENSELTTASDAQQTSSPSIFQQCRNEREAKDWCYDHSARGLSGQQKQRMCRTSITRYNQCLAGADRPSGDPAFNNVDNYRNPDRREAYVNGSANCRQRSNDTMTCLICNCHNEAGIESREGKVQVNRTVLARVASPSYPDSICGVIWQRAQFSWTLPSVREENVTGRHYNACYHAAKEALAEGSNGACFYHGNYISPRWARNKRRANVGNNGALGRHIFYRC